MSTPKYSPSRSRRQRRTKDYPEVREVLERVIAEMPAGNLRDEAILAWELLEHDSRRGHANVFARKMVPIMAAAQAEHQVVSRIAKRLNDAGHRSFYGRKWSENTVSALITRIAALKTF